MQFDAGALAKIQKAAAYGRVLFTAHAREEMVNANVRQPDVVRAIRTAKTASPSEDGEGRYVLRGGVDLSGDELVVVAKEITPGVIVVTVW